MEKRQAEMWELHDRAIQKLEQQEDWSPEIGKERYAKLKLWRYQSFGPYTVWIVSYLPDLRKQGQAFVRTIEWDQLNDKMRLYDPMEGVKRGFHTKPAIVQTDTRIDNRTLVKLIREGQELTINPFIKAGEIGLDGETWRFEHVSGFDKIYLSWWETGPKEWASFTAWVRKLQSHLIESIHGEEQHG